MAKGLRQRWENLPTDAPPGAGCPPNRWKGSRASQTLPTDADKRYITLVIANYGAFERNGITVLPITKFGRLLRDGLVHRRGLPRDARLSKPDCTRIERPSPHLSSVAERHSRRRSLRSKLTKSSKERSGDASSRRSFRRHSAGRASRRAFSSELGTCIAVLVESSHAGFDGAANAQAPSASSQSNQPSGAYTVRAENDVVSACSSLN